MFPMIGRLGPMTPIPQPMLVAGLGSLGGILGPLQEIVEGAQMGLNATCQLGGRRITESVAATAWLDAQRSYDLIGRANYESVVRQLSNYLVWRFGSEQEVCRRFYLSSGQSLTQFSRQFIDEAAAIGMGLLRVPNTRQPELTLSFVLLYLMQGQMQSRGLDCFTYLTRDLGIEGLAARSICTALAGTPPAQGFSVGLTRGFDFSVRLIRLAREALDTLIQAPPAPRPVVTQLPSIQIAPPIR